jgi:hypothetical protein
MDLRLRFRTLAVAVLGATSLGSVAFAAGMDAQVPPGVLAPAGITQRLSELADQPATHTGFVLDRSELQLAQSMLQQGGVDAEHAAAALSSISFDSFRYREPAFYTPETMASILEVYHRAGWKHLVNGNQTPANMAQPRTAITDVWLHFTGADIDHVTVLVRGARDMNLIQVAGDLRPIDLLHLGGHFGIPKVDPSAVMVPAPNGR